MRQALGLLLLLISAISLASEELDDEYSYRYKNYPDWFEPPSYCDGEHCFDYTPVDDEYRENKEKCQDTCGSFALMDVFIRDSPLAPQNCRGNQFETLKVHEARLLTDRHSLEQYFEPTVEFAAPPNHYISSLNTIHMRQAPNHQSFVVKTYSDRGFRDLLNEDCYPLRMKNCLTFPSSGYRAVGSLEVYIKRLWCDSGAPEEGCNSPSI